MDFFTRCWKSTGCSLPGLLLSLLVFWPVAGLAQGESAEIAQLQVERMEGGVYLTAQLKFELSAAVEDALLKGIPVHFVAQAQLLRDRWYWTDKRVGTVTRQMRLTYQPLTQRWKLSQTQGAGLRTGFALNQTFDTLAEALQSLSRLSRWKIAESADLEPDARYNVDFSFKLDSAELPRPLQIGILGQSEWNLAVSKNQRVTAEALK
jgi:hypothetical protein